VAGDDDDEQWSGLPPLVVRQLKIWRAEAAKRAVDDPPPVLRVLVWGPGSGESDSEGRKLLQGKRMTIVESLRLRGHAAVTSEELLASGEGRQQNLGSMPLQFVEQHQAETADFLIALVDPSSPGSVAECAGLLTKRTIARRAAVFVEGEISTTSYLDLGPLHSISALGVVHGYDRSDLADCRVATTAIKLAMDQADSLRGTSE
jgi:hypothetical protein